MHVFGMNKHICCEVVNQCNRCNTLRGDMKDIIAAYHTGVKLLVSSLMQVRTQVNNGRATCSNTVRRGTNGESGILARPFALPDHIRERERAKPANRALKDVRDRPLKRKSATYKRVLAAKLATRTRISTECPTPRRLASRSTHFTKNVSTITISSGRFITSNPFRIGLNCRTDFFL